MNICVNDCEHIHLTGANKIARGDLFIDINYVY